MSGNNILKVPGIRMLALWWARIQSATRYKSRDPTSQPSVDPVLSTHPHGSRHLITTCRMNARDYACSWQFYSLDAY